MLIQTNHPMFCRPTGEKPGIQMCFEFPGFRVALDYQLARNDT